MVQPVRFSITASAAEKFEDEKSDIGESNFSSESEIEDAGDNQATFAVVDRLKISSEPQRAASCTDSGEKCVSRVNSAGAASFMFCVYLPFSSLFWFRGGFRAPDLTFPIKKSLYNITVTLKAGFHMIADRNKVCDRLRSCDRDRRRSQKIEPCSI